MHMGECDRVQPGAPLSMNEGGPRALQVEVCHVLGMFADCFSAWGGLHRQSLSRLVMYNGGSFPHTSSYHAIHCATVVSCLFLPCCYIFRVCEKLRMLAFFPASDFFL